MQLSREHCLLGQESGKEHLAYYGTVWYGVRHSSRHSSTAHYSHHEHRSGLHLVYKRRAYHRICLRYSSGAFKVQNCAVSIGLG